MNQLQIIISEPRVGCYQMDVRGRFGGGFSGLTTDRAGVLSRISLLKNYDCGSEPAAVIVPKSLEPEFRKIFPKSFQMTATEPTPEIEAICGQRRRKLEAQLAQQGAMEAIVAKLPPEVRERVWLNDDWLQICSPSREQTKAAMECLAAGKWTRKPCENDTSRLSYEAAINGVLVVIYRSEPPPSCRIVEEEIEVPAHKTIVRKLICH